MNKARISIVVAASAVMLLAAPAAHAGPSTDGTWYVYGDISVTQPFTVTKMDTTQKATRNKTFIVTCHKTTPNVCQGDSGSYDFQRADISSPWTRVDKS